ncbi:hypothetical protein [Halalkalibacter akibai]|uniref:hypothetical protein n=1 Tax=Halalkalibacter akibai TaxID=1411 RepID=UPI000552E31F|nr:hypothetical protein [Halalkalibacter akibai]
MERLIKQSLNDGLKLEMIYQANNGVFSQRIITVKSFNDHHIIAYCFYRKQTRMFRRDRIFSLFFCNRQHSSVKAT